jgi:hypothetical protein
MVMKRKTFILAGPSFVVPGTIQDNVLALKDLVSEVGLTFFQSRASLDYTREDMPASLAWLGLKYHVHLPLDLNWRLGADQVFQVASALVQKAGFLSPDKFVLHPPAEAGELEEFALLWQKSGLNPGKLLIENINGNDLSSLWKVIEEQGLGICLDIGHIMAYNQMNILEHDLVWERTSLVHVYGREDQTGHIGLTAISGRGKRALQLILSRVKEGTSVLLEIFSLQDFLDSKAILIQMADSWGMDFDRPGHGK